MLDLISNTLDIIVKLSNSDTGYLFKANSNSFDILSYAGNDPSIYEPLNLALLNIHLSFSINQQKAENDPAFSKSATLLAVKSFYLTHILNSSERHFDIYLVLLSKGRDNYQNKFTEAFSEEINTLSHQVREWTNSSEILEAEAEMKNSYSTDFDKEDTNDERIFFNLSTDLQFILNREGNFSKINKKGAEAINQSTGKLLGKHFLDIVEETNKTKVLEILREALHSKKEINFEVILIDDLGENFHYLMNVRTICVSDKICGLAGVAKNINQIKSLEAKINQLTPKLIETERLLNIERHRAQHDKFLLTELNKLKNEFISNISHELRTPLASIIGFSETIESDDNIPEEMRKDFNRIILSEGKRLAKLINDVLELSRIESGTVVLNRSNFEIVELLNEVIDGFKSELSAKHIHLTTEFSEDEIFLFADREKISQVFNGLFNNAIKFTDMNGRITVIVQSLLKEAEVIISDTGAGIPEKDLPFIFEKFFRVQRKDEEIAGAGLGLVFVKEIVDLHKGYVQIQSEVNKGTSVVIRLLKSQRINLNSGN